MGVAEFNDFKDRKLIQAQQGDVDSGVVLGGQVTGYIEDKPTVEELVQRIVAEAQTAYDDLPLGR